MGEWPSSRNMPANAPNSIKLVANGTKHMYTRSTHTHTHTHTHTRTHGEAYTKHGYVYVCAQKRVHRSARKRKRQSNNIAPADTGAALRRSHSAPGAPLHQCVGYAPGTHRESAPVGHLLDVDSPPQRTSGHVKTVHRRSGATSCLHLR